MTSPQADVFPTTGGDRTVEVISVEISAVCFRGVDPRESTVNPLSLTHIAFSIYSVYRFMLGQIAPKPVRKPRQVSLQQVSQPMFPDYVNERLKLSQLKSSGFRGVDPS